MLMTQCTILTFCFISLLFYHLLSFFRYFAIRDGLKVDADDYFFATEMLKSIAHRYCQDRIVSVLEGGYNIDAIKLCSREHLISLVTETRTILSENPNRMSLSKDIGILLSTFPFTPFALP